MEDLLERKVFSSMSAVDPVHDVVVTTFLLEPIEGDESDTFIEG